MSFLRFIRGQFAGRVAAMAGATFVQAVLTVALLPLTTRVLSAADFGVYGLLLSLAALAGAMSDGGAGLLLPAHYTPAPLAERARLWTSLALFATVISVALGMLVLALYPWRSLIFTDGTLDNVPYLAFAATAALIPVRAWSQLTTTTFSVAGRGIAIASQTLAQSVITFSVTLVALFPFDLGVAALFLGTLAGQAAALAVGLCVLGSGQTIARPSRVWLALIARTAPTASAAGLVDGLRAFAENAILGTLRGLAAVGIFGHARLYHGFMLALGNAVAHNAWAISLAEARNPQSDFSATRRMWAPIYLAVTLVGLVFAFVGREIVDLLTTGKLTEAAILVPVFAALTLIQNSGKAASAVVYAYEAAPAATRLRAVLILTGLLAAFPAISIWGVAGLMGVLVVEALIFRLILRALARRHRRLPWQDSAAAAGTVALLAAIAYVHAAEPSLALRLVLLVVAGAIAAVLGRRTLADMIGAGRKLLRAGSA